MQDMDEAATGLLTSVNQINVSSDRKKGWAGVSNACRIIGGNTIRVLKIVYGAQLQRLVQSSDNTLNLLDTIDVALVTQDPQQFADIISEVAGKVADLGVYTTDKANDEASPVSRDEVWHDVLCILLYLLFNVVKIRRRRFGNKERGFTECS